MQKQKSSLVQYKKKLKLNIDLYIIRFVNYKIIIYNL
jgi:hypothetical protein